MFCALTAAPIRTRILIALAWPLIAAAISGVAPSLCHAAAACKGHAALRAGTA